MGRIGGVRRLHRGIKIEIKGTGGNVREKQSKNETLNIGKNHYMQKGKA